MTVLADLRAELVDALATNDITAFYYVPKVVNPPVALVAPDDPYVQEFFDTKTFDHDYKVNMIIRLVSGNLSNEEITTELDNLIVNTLTALHGMWETDVSQPFVYEVGGKLYLATDVSISTTITIT